jgi:uncharacterized protein (DUF58 family)
MKFIRALYFNNRFFQLVVVLVLVFIATFILDLPTIIAKGLFLMLLTLLLVDLLILFRIRKGIKAHRFTPEKLSNGDENELRIFIENGYPFKISLSIIDEIPFQFQKRDMEFQYLLDTGENKTIHYFLRPTKRGEYSFGAVNIFATSPLGLVSRRYQFSQDKVVPVYPSYLQMRKYELLAISNRLTDVGIKKIRRIGQNMEFERIREYVSGDDYRTINWKATARKRHLMVNNYQDERSQQVYSLIDKGRAMQMPFNGMSLLDYAINASLVISNIAIKKSDKAGLITFQHKIGTTLPASSRSHQMTQILEVLYNQKTAFKESDFSTLFSHVRRKISQRSLLLLFTNFESIYSLDRQLPFLKNLAKYHLLVVIFFENTEMKEVLTQPAGTLKAVYVKAIAEKFALDKKLIAKELQKNGIHSLLTTPEHLSVDTINKYLELKSRGLI